MQRVQQGAVKREQIIERTAKPPPDIWGLGPGRGDVCGGAVGRPAADGGGAAGGDEVSGGGAGGEAIWRGAGRECGARALFLEAQA